MKVRCDHVGKPRCLHSRKHQCTHGVWHESRVQYDMHLSRVQYDMHLCANWSYPCWGDRYDKPVYVSVVCRPKGGKR